MEAIIDQARKQNIWKEPETPKEALAILDNVDLTGIVDCETPKKRRRTRLNELSWTTLAQDYYVAHCPHKRSHKSVDNPA